MAFDRSGNIMRKPFIRNTGIAPAPSPNGQANKFPDSRGPTNTGQANKYPGSGRGMPVPLMPGG